MRMNPSKRPGIALPLGLAGLVLVAGLCLTG